MGKSPRNRSGHSAVLDDQAKIYIFGGYSVIYKLSFMIFKSEIYF